METIAMSVVLALISMASLCWGKILSIRLPEIDGIFDRKPFNCRPCLTFHLICFLSILFAIAISSIAAFAAGLIIAFIVFFIVKYIDNQKVIK